jgi:hypothetical protein
VRTLASIKIQNAHTFCLHVHALSVPHSVCQSVTMCNYYFNDSTTLK